MGTRLLSAADRSLANPILRGIVLLGYLAMAAIFAVVFPDTPDELSRLEIAERIRDAGSYSWFRWPPGNILTILSNPFLGSGPLDDFQYVRLFNLAIVAVPILFLMSRIRDSRLLLVALFVAPYSFLVLSTGSQQGLMIGLFALIAIAIIRQRLVLLAAAAVLLYLVNPAMVLALPFALLFGARQPWFRRAFALACLAYVPIFIAALVFWNRTGHFMPTLAENGPINIFRGNNPHPVDGDGTDAAVAYFRDDPAGFFGNMLRKFALHWMPWDFLRSGMGQGVSGVLFTYIGLSQVAIYSTFWRYRRHIDRSLLIFALAMCVAAWGLYTLFFVKIRFRVPFDLLLLMCCMLAPFAHKLRTERAASDGEPVRSHEEELASSA